MKNLALILCLLCPFLVQGHAGGHYSSGDLMKIWHLQNGQHIEGNFAYGNSESITIEQLHGKLQTIFLTDLQSNDRKIAEIKINRYENIHGFGVISQPSKPSKPSFPWMRWISVYLMALVVLQGYAINKQKKWLQPISLACLFVGVFWACKTETSISPSNTTTSTPIATKTSISFLDSAFAPYKKTISTTYDDTYYYVNSNGMPEHNMMVGITSWQQQVPIPQPNVNNCWIFSTLKDEIKRSHV
jgi:hypothetical protein